MAQVAVLVAVGVAIGGLIKSLGDPGDVELLVDNVHVDGGSSDARALRSLLSMLLTSQVNLIASQRERSPRATRS